MWCLKSKENSNSYRILRWHEKSPASWQKKFPSHQKKFPKGLDDFAPIFGKLTTHYVMFEIKKTQILIEFLDGTKKVQLADKKSFLVAKKSSPRV